MSKKVKRPLPETEIKALKWIEARPGTKYLEIYQMSGSRGHPKYIVDNLTKKGLIEPSKVDEYGWQLTKNGHNELMMYRKDVEIESDMP